MNIISLFSGCGGLDLGFKNAGYNIIWANEHDKTIIPTHKHNFPETFVDTRSITEIQSSEIPNNADGIIGGPPCQAFSEAGKGLGVEDTRGKLFFEYIRVIQDKQPKFFVAENVSGLLHKKHRETLKAIQDQFKNMGYIVSMQLLNAHHFNVPQDRLRVIFVGYRTDSTSTLFSLKPKKNMKPLVLKDAIEDLKDTAMPAKPLNKTNSPELHVPNHEYMIGGFSTIFMSRNRVRSWNEPSFTIQASGRHAPIHPIAPKMLPIEVNKRIFVPNKEHLYRRLSVRECARIQTFPDTFQFLYHNISNGYKMVGNAVPVNLAHAIAHQIKKDLE